MDFSKQSIVSRCFSKKTFGGLDEAEVRDCLNVLADEIERLRQIVLMQEGKLKEQQGFIEESRDREHIIKESIAVVQRVTDKIRKDAEEQSETMLQNARDKKRALLKEARGSMQSIYDDIAGLKRLYVQFKAGLTASVQAHLDLLKEDGAFSSALLESPSSEEESEEDDEDFLAESRGFSLSGEEGEGASLQPSHSFRPTERLADERPEGRQAASGESSFSSLDKETEREAATDRISADRSVAGRIAADGAAEARPAANRRATGASASARAIGKRAERAGLQKKPQTESAGLGAESAAENRFSANRAHKQAGAHPIRAGRSVAGRAHKQAADGSSADALRKESARSLSESLKSLTEDFL